MTAAHVGCFAKSRGANVPEFQMPDEYRDRSGEAARELQGEEKDNLP
jgi:hypothetical protein